MKRSSGGKRRASVADAGAGMFALLHAADVMRRRMDDALGSVGLSPSKYGVLAELAKEEEALPLSELAARLSCVRSNMTQLIDRMEAEGQVVRVATPGDRRSVRAQITPQGLKQWTTGEKKMRELHEQFVGQVGESDRTVLARVARKLNE